MRPASVPPIEWEPVTPRSGLAGSWDRLVGPGATGAENAITILAGICGVALAWALAPEQWAAWKVVLACVLAFDIIGGIAANASAAAQRWYHRPGVSRREHLGFAALHVVQIAAVALAYRDGDAGYAVAGMAWLLGAVAAILWAPLHVRRALALCGVLAGAVLLDVAFSPTPGLEWFASAFYLKLLAAHANREAPFAPARSELKRSGACGGEPRGRASADPGCRGR